MPGEWDDLLVNTASIVKVPRKAGKSGESMPQPEVIVAEGVPCSIQYASGSRTIQQGREGQSITHRVFFGTAQPLKVGMILRPTSPAGPDLFVLDFLDPSAGHGEVFAADCEQQT